MTTFKALGVSDNVVQALSNKGISEAFPIQAETIEASLAGRDICGKAPTGSGKTLAFGVPVVDLVEQGTPWQPAALILAPTRELASQIKDELEPLAKARKRNVVTVFGGTNIERDIKRLEQGVDILVACPGRLEDLISRRCCDLRDASLVVVDEADRMADMGFLPAVKRLLDQTPGNRHTLLFSATLDGDVKQLIDRYQDKPLTVEVEEQVADVGDVPHSWYLVQPNERVDSAVAVLQRYWSSIVFCRTRRGCDRVAKMFNKKGLKAVAIHGDRSQNQRERALKDFTSGKAQVLVATDVAARGIHVDNVSLVMHYDPAGTDKDYIHRSGRTGRAGADGRVISMVVEDKKKVARALQKDLGLKPGFDDLDLAEFGAIVERPIVKDEPHDSRDGQHGSGGGRGSKGRSSGTRSSGSRSGGGGEHRGRQGNRSSSNRSGGSRSNENRPGRGRSERNDDDRRDGGGGRDRRTRDDRGGRSSGRYGRDDVDAGDREGGSRGSRSQSSRGRDGRGPDGRRKTETQRPGRPKGNDWYPPEKKKRWRDDDERGASRSERSSGDGGSGRGRTSAGSDGEDKPGGSNSTPRKTRSSKGRHADRDKTNDKGRRRPRS